MILPEADYIKYKESTIYGRYVTNKQVTTYLKNACNELLVETVGYSVQKRAIQSVTIGKGQNKLLCWSQMHGNESTTTKSVLDLLNFLRSGTVEASNILKHCTLKIILIVNPDGAEAYTRVNANNIDLNRDAQDQSQPESVALRTVYENFQPDFCFNLHDQRTIFNVGATPKPATVSFLAPAHNEERSISATRGISMQLIVAMNQTLQKLIPQQVGRYDDGFNANCVGDTFQMLDTPTVLFEAGHFYKDYDREKTREYIFWALLSALDCITEKNMDTYVQSDYFAIPENQKRFVDVLIKNAHLLKDTNPTEIAILYKEVLNNGKINFEPKIEKITLTGAYFGHKIFDCSDEIDLETMKKESFWNLPYLQNIE